MTNYFQIDEFRCKCCNKAEVNSLLLHKLNLAREHYGHPIVILSGYRCPSHNTAVGGVPHSYHTQGQAADLLLPPPHLRLRLIEALLYVGFIRMGFYTDGFIHVDVGTNPSTAVWIK